MPTPKPGFACKDCGAPCPKTSHFHHYRLCSKCAGSRLERPPSGEEGSALVTPGEPRQLAHMLDLCGARVPLSTVSKWGQGARFQAFEWARSLLFPSTNRAGEVAPALPCPEHVIEWLGQWG